MSAVEKPKGITPAMQAQVEGVQELMRRTGGTADADFWINLFFRAHKTAKLFKGEDVDPVAEEEIVAKATGVALAAFKPADPVEGMFAAQAVMLNNLALEAGRLAVISGQSPDVASKLRKDAANTSRAFSDTVDALARYRGKGPQVVRVERVVVNEGGQAVVGHVSPGASLAAPTAPTAAAKALERGSVPMPTLDVEPVKAGQGEGA